MKQDHFSVLACDNTKFFPYFVLILTEKFSLDRQKEGGKIHIYRQNIRYSKACLQENLQIDLIGVRIAQIIEKKQAD
jgi:hypothetical protein